MRKLVALDSSVQVSLKRVGAQAPWQIDICISLLSTLTLLKLFRCYSPAL